MHKPCTAAQFTEKLNREIRRPVWRAVSRIVFRPHAGLLIMPACCDYQRKLFIFIDKFLRQEKTLFQPQKFPGCCNTFRSSTV